MPGRPLPLVRGAMLLASVAGAAAIACSAPARRALPLPRVRYAPVTHGVAAGDVSSDRVVIWSRTDRTAAMHVAVEDGARTARGLAWATAAHDFAAKATIEGLTPGTEHRYTVWFSDEEGTPPPPPPLATGGVFRTAPGENAAVPVTFGWSGDLGGLQVCRDPARGYPIFRTLDGAGLDFFLGLGDMIYADQPCAAKNMYGEPQIPIGIGAATTLREYWAYWRYNREDAGLRRLLAGTGYYAVWDDHEVVNDFGPGTDYHLYPPYAPFASLIPLGRRALLDENPIATDPQAPDRLHRAFRWGKTLDLVLLDTRSFRDDNAAPDTGPRPKTMLGQEQRAWLVDRLRRSDATWKIVASSVPIAVPTGRGGSAGHDGWAGYDLDVGFERELRAIFSDLRDGGVQNVVFLTTDVHFSTGIRYRPFPESHDFSVIELSAGPLGAMPLPTEALDDSLHPERLFLYRPGPGPRSFDEAQTWMNWGKVVIDAAGRFALTIHDGNGREVEHLDLTPGVPRGSRGTLGG